MLTNFEKEQMRGPLTKTNPNGRRTLQSALKHVKGQVRVRVIGCVCV